LLSSIKDGRYEEQSYRLNGLNIHNHNIVYLIEGTIGHTINRFKSDASNSSEKITFYSAMLSLNYFKGFSVFRSFSLEETALIICNMAYKLEKSAVTKKPFYPNTCLSLPLPAISLDLEPQIEDLEQNDTEKEEPEHLQNENTQNEKDYVSVIKKVKKDNITVDNIGEIMLCQIPGVSSVTALAVMEKYKSLPNLIKELDANNDCLKDTTTTTKGQSRKISKTIISNIVKFLLKK
jgi:ERCC4-type nuclease